MVTSEQQMSMGAPGFSLRAPEAILRSDRRLRYERGGTVYATDGKLGTLRQVVVDERAGEVRALAVEIHQTGEVVLLPPQAVSKTGGSAVFLAGSQLQYEEWLERAPRYQPKNASKVNVKSLLKRRGDAATDPRQVVVRAGRDYLETDRNARPEMP